MQFRDLKKQYQVLKPQMDEAVTKVMTNCNFISGQQVKDLESSLASYVGTKHCVTCANGTDALTLCMMTLGVTKGDAVFVPDFTFFSTGEIVSFEGATPVFVDVCKDTFNMDPISLEKAIEVVKSEGKLKLKGVIPVDLFGLPYDADAINEIAHKNGMFVVEDGAQGFGGRYKGRVACSLGDMATTSFFPAKPVGCYGDGGAIFTNDDEIDALLRSLCVHGKGSFKYDNIRIGMNSRLDTIQAAILQIKLDAFDKFELSDVNSAAKWYDELLKDVVIIPKVANNCLSSWAQYTIILESEEQRNELQDYLKTKEIPTMVYYPKPMHMQEAFVGCGYCVDLSVTEKLCKTVLSLPMHPYLDKKICKQIADDIKDFLRK